MYTKLAYFFINFNYYWFNRFKSVYPKVKLYWFNNIKNLGKDEAVVHGQVELSGPSDIRKGLLSHRDVGYCQQVLCGVARGKTIFFYVDKESEDGFSPGYILLSFQILTSSSGQPKADRSVWSKATSVALKIYPPYPPYPPILHTPNLVYISYPYSSSFIS